MKTSYKIIISISTTFIQLELSIHLNTVLMLNSKKPFIEMSSLNNIGLFDFTIIFSEQECKEKMSVLAPSLKESASLFFLRLALLF